MHDEPPSEDQPAALPPEALDARATEPDGAARRRPARVLHPVAVHLMVLLGYIGAGIAVTWPHASYLAGRMAATRDAGCYVWDFWWMARSVEHLSSPWSTSYLAAPVGTQLGFHTLMPLAGVVMLPVTTMFGPTASFNLLSIALPGMQSYAMYRVARLWLPSQIAAIAAGGFFGYSVIVDYWAWVHVNLAAGALFVPLALEAAARLRRRPGPAQALILGLVIGASVLVDQDSALMAAMLAAAALLPWLLGRPAPPDPADMSIAARILSAPRWTRLLPLALAALAAGVVASPQLLAIAHEIKVAGPPATPSATAYLAGAWLPNVVEPSPRVTNLGLSIPHSPDFTTYGAVLTALAIAGLVLAWRQRTAWGLAIAWAGATVLAMGSAIHIGASTYVPLAQVWHGVPLSSLMPYTWIVRTPGLASFREPARIAEVGLVPAALLAGFTVNWLREHAAPVLVAVLAVGVLEAGLCTPAGFGAMPTALPALDRPIAADHSRSIVVDVPFGIRGGAGLLGAPFAPESQVLATADDHPLAVANLSRITPATASGIRGEPFYRALMRVQKGHYQLSAAQLTATARNARRMDIGWVLLWTADRHLQQYLLATGFRCDYRASGVAVYRPASAG
ncbi:MAG TPA: hypothetical protein VMU94_15835 [Streptosporangiaceae bacterium]|nr:hypothetical protein [Streptosporangiaceae bacterium]